MIYSNPIIPGFYPDPSICRVGQDYYLVTSSFEYFPGVPIFHSRDLLNWRQIGHCLTRTAQLNLTQAGSSAGIMAPTLRYYKGLFFLATTNISHQGSFYVYTDNPASNQWSDPILVDQPGIDASLFWDADNDRIYFASTGTGDGIYQSEIDLNTGRLLTSPCKIWSGTGGTFPEAPHLYKKGSYYYLMISEGGTQYGHMVTMARSRHPNGPFEACPYNPILTHRHLVGEPIQGTGHADLVEAEDGSWWAVFLAFRPQNWFFHHLGRETFLAPVNWTADEWFRINDGKSITLTMEAELPHRSLHPWSVTKCRDGFEGDQLALNWNFIRNLPVENWSLSARPGWLRLIGSALTLEAIDAVAFIGRRQQHFYCRASTRLDFAPKEDEEAGLTVFANHNHHYEVALRCVSGERQVFVRQRIGNLSVVVAWAKSHSDLPVQLEVKANSENYIFSFADDNGHFQWLATAPTRYLATEVVGGFTGVYFGLYATGNGQPCAIPADFDWFDYEETKPV